MANVIVSPTNSHSVVFARTRPVQPFGKVNSDYASITFSLLITGLDEQAPTNNKFVRSLQYCNGQPVFTCTDTYSTFKLFFWNRWGAGWAITDLPLTSLGNGGNEGSITMIDICWWCNDLDPVSNTWTGNGGYVDGAQFFGIVGYQRR